MAWGRADALLARGVRASPGAAPRKAVPLRLHLAGAAVGTEEGGAGGSCVEAREGNEGAHPDWPSMSGYIQQGNIYYTKRVQAIILRDRHEWNMIRGGSGKRVRGPRQVEKVHHHTEVLRVSAYAQV